MIRKCHNNKLQTNPQQREKETHGIYSNNTIKRQKLKAKQPALFLVKMIAKYERTLSNAKPKQRPL